MFKLTFFLCAGLFTAMYFGGADRGQQRFGLVEKPRVVAAPVADAPVVGADAPAVVAAPAVIPVTEAAFVPEAPLMVTPAVEETSSAPVVAEPIAAEPGVLMVVNAKSANVRSGPGKDYDVVGRLMRGDSVLVVAQGEGADGWSLIRIEGDGIEGYIATRLLTE
ncbi:SH3 domain-containing protein [Cypionkella psychrotolerans]|uniref:SH3 domain-containing protein n=1 Tax=Cypionkella psychrotolerans TaxID=1678131 RepID=UPI00138EED9C|nr:SH3 domain-containing protein [Cypionkella psychrotolerans]